MDQQLVFKIWFAGFYEGEGSISNDKSNNNRLRVSVSQNDILPLKKASEIWGGKVRERVRKSPASDKICIGYEWQISHVQSIKFIDDIKPYMIIPYKIQQVEKAFEKFKEGFKATFPCHFCAKSYANVSGRRRHEKTEHIQKGQMFLCSVCDCNRTFKFRDSLRRHIKINHGNTNASSTNEEVEQGGSIAGKPLES